MDAPGARGDVPEAGVHLWWAPGGALLPYPLVEGPHVSRACVAIGECLLPGSFLAEFLSRVRRPAAVPETTAASREHKDTVHGPGGSVSTLPSRTQPASVSPLSSALCL